VRFRYRSLYSRIGIGFIVCIAIELTIQGGILLWLVNREDPDARTFFTLGLANDLAIALRADPRLDIDGFINDRYADPPRAFYVVMATGDVFYYGDKRPTSSAIAGVLDEFRRPGFRTMPHRWEAAPYWASAIVVDGVQKGLVSVVARNFPADLWRPMVLLASTLLVVGTVLASRFIFGPAHRRLMELERTALQLGAGDINARAEESGGDEVASLARTFNIMAANLTAREAQIADDDRTRRLLLADISHELMTPLTAIRACQERLLADPQTGGSPERRRYIQIIGEEAFRVERIVRDLLDLARFESGRNVLDVQDVSIEGLFGRVATRQESAAAARHVTISTTIEAGAEVVRGDQYRLEQALQNLAANAVRHVPEGGSVRLHAAQSQRDIIITVSDTGVGITAEHLPFIFDRFYKVDSARAAAGSGLGLSIAKAIVEQHGGRISVESKPDVETVFTIRLPATEAAARTGGQPARREPLTASADRPRPAATKI
jgi:signal transduction histidine kinase